MRQQLDVFWDPRVLLHETGLALHEAASGPWTLGQPHTEGPDRIRGMVDILQNGPIRDRLVWHGGRKATEDELLRIHPQSYIDEVRTTSEAGGGWVTGTTRLGANSYDHLLVAAGTSIEAARLVARGESKAAVAVVRPPGHHAQISQADGYCFFNHAALMVDVLQQHGHERVLVVDWDVHHGNGTQDIFYDRDDVLTTSIHMNHGAWGPSHPQTGYPDETGDGVGEGYNINIALPLGAGDSAYTRAVEEIIEPVARQFMPDAIVVANGQDASAFDPNGRHNVSMTGFYGVGQRIAQLSDELCDGRLVLVQEGGYNVSYAPYCLLGTLEGVLGANQTSDPLAYVPDQTLGVDEALQTVKHSLPRWF